MSEKGDGVLGHASARGTSCRFAEGVEEYRGCAVGGRYHSA